MSGGLSLMGQNVLDQGGYTQGIKVAHLAEAHHLPMVTGGAWHLQNAHLIAAATNGWMNRIPHPRSRSVGDHLRRSDQADQQQASDE